jgi:hypothetical protein
MQTLIEFLRAIGEALEDGPCTIDGVLQTMRAGGRNPSLTRREVRDGLMRMMNRGEVVLREGRLYELRTFGRRRPDLELARPELEKIARPFLAIYPATDAATLRRALEEAYLAGARAALKK